MASHDIQVGDKTEKLTFTIDPKSPNPWNHIVDVASDYIMCHRGCFGDIATPGLSFPGTHLDGEPSQLVVEPSTRPCRSKRHVSPWTKNHYIYRRLRQIVSSSLRNNMFYSLMHRAPSDSKSEKHSTLSLTDIPVEILLHIAELVVGPYELKAHLCLEEWDPLLLAFPFPRNWSSIKIFHICKSFRMVAVTLYGHPDPNSLPFNPNLDKVVISEMARLVRARSIFRSFREWHSIYDEAYYKKPLLICNGTYCYNMELNMPRVLSRKLWIIPELFNRIERIEITTGIKPAIFPALYNETTWGRMFKCLSDLAPKLKIMSISIRNFDNCQGGYWNMAPPDQLWKIRDVDLLKGFRWAVERMSVGSFPKRLFPRLQTLEILKLEPRCSINHNGDITLDLADGRFISNTREIYNYYSK
ncbi:hypothetical protein M434DRAFT_27468 [Hypoxylon sp. CO27-5]|nr:hypothetical protein M434DRAFT_27468 [Hypoxylon sp. CO27-5]